MKEVPRAAARTASKKKTVSKKKKTSRKKIASRGLPTGRAWERALLDQLTALGAGQREVYLITGAASGIGKHLCQVFADEGKIVVACDIKAADLKKLGKANERIVPCRLDVTDPRAWRDLLALLFDRGPGLHVLMNVAGVIRPGYATEIAPETVDLHFKVNTNGVIYGTMYAARQMLRVNRGHIINVASMAALAPVPGLGLYSASKHAVRAFSLSTGLELKGSGVAVTVLCPDPVRTPMLDQQATFEEAALTFAAPRYFSVEEVTEVIQKRILPRRPLEVIMPRTRGWLARMANTIPGAMAPLANLFRKSGIKRMQKFRGNQNN